MANIAGIAIAVHFHPLLLDHAILRAFILFPFSQRFTTNLVQNSFALLQCSEAVSLWAFVNICEPD